MAKDEVYSWRLTLDVKTALEEQARRRGVSVATLLEEITGEWLRSAAEGTDAEAEQRRLRAAAEPFVGAIRGRDPDRAAEARQRVRERLRRGRAGR
jgi:hypothetical protein